MIWQQEIYLKLSRSQGLVSDKELKKGVLYDFKKPGHRIYPLDFPIDLISADWQAKAKVIICELNVGHGYTKGKFKIIKIFTHKDAKAITNNLFPYNK